MPWTTAHNHNCCKQKCQQLGVTSRFKKVCVNTVSYGFIWFYVWFVSAHHSFAQGSRFRTLAVFGCFCLTEMPWYAGSISLWFKSIYNHLYVADIGRCFEPKINSPGTSPSDCSDPRSIAFQMIPDVSTKLAKRRAIKESSNSLYDQADGSQSGGKACVVTVQQVTRLAASHMLVHWHQKESRNRFNRIQF